MKTKIKTEITFGTDGFRGIIAREFTYETLKRIIDAITLYLRNLKQEKNTIIVGFDSRFMACDFAKFCAELLKNYGFKVILSSKVIPTPIVAYNAKFYPNSIGAIMLTASHNPPEYQGIKFIPNYAGPADKDITDKILKFLDKEVIKLKGGELLVQELEDSYFEHIEKIIDFNIIKKNPQKIIYDGLYSSSIGYFDKILDKYSIEYKSFNMHHDPLFGGGLPEPKEKFMHHHENGFITVANDGDADRYGVIDEIGNYVSPNIILALLLKYLSKKGMKGKIAKTVGVSKIVDIVAKKLNIETITTPVGFKWLSKAMRENNVIIAGEDSGGLSIQGHIPEKDGILANLLIIEMMAYENKSLNELVNEIKKFIGCEFYTTRVDVKLDSDNDKTILEEKFAKLNMIANFEIKEKLAIDGLKLFLDNKNTTLLIRPSGTEPLLRFYIESDKIENLNKIKEFVSLST